MNQKELKELIEFLIEKDIAEFELERGDVKVKIKRAGRAHRGADTCGWRPMWP
jgi:biotin carboxyl carrier protein